MKNKFSTFNFVSSVLPSVNYLLQICCCLLIFTACKEEVVDYQTNDCKRMPAFVKSLGFDLTRTAFSTSEKKIVGVVLVQKDLAKGVNSTGEKIYQHPSWKSAGSMGPIQLDPQGNCFVGPVPVINVIDNPTAKQNIIYKVDAVSGEMKPFVELPIIAAIPNNNPYGILGFAYLCESNTLYVSTVLGSDRQHENGVIYAVDITSGKVIDKIINTDAMGMGISFISGNRKLYFGSARTQNIFSIILSSEGKFKTKPQLEFSITDIGPRGDDKVRRIKFDKAGQMQLHAIEFNFNLTAPTEKQESIYNFAWEEEKKIWIFNK